MTFDNFVFLKHLIFLLVGFYLGSETEEAKRVPKKLKDVIQKKIKTKKVPKGQIMAPDPEWVNKSKKERETEKYLTKRFAKLLKRNK